eukprot:3179329-Pyramimonas_sp.AAC.1
MSAICSLTVLTSVAARFCATPGPAATELEASQGRFAPMMNGDSPRHCTASPCLSSGLKPFEM